MFWQFFWIPLTKNPLESEYCGVAPRWCGLLYCNPNHIAATSNHSNGFLIVSHPASAHIVCVLHVCVLLHWNLGVVWAVTKSTWAIQGQQLLKSGKVVHVVFEYEKFNLQKTFISFLGMTPQNYFVYLFQQSIKRNQLWTVNCKYASVNNWLQLSGEQNVFLWLLLWEGSTPLLEPVAHIALQPAEVTAM